MVLGLVCVYGEECVWIEIVDNLGGRWKGGGGVVGEMMRR